MQSPWFHSLPNPVGITYQKEKEKKVAPGRVLSWFLVVSFDPSINHPVKIYDYSFFIIKNLGHSFLVSKGWSIFVHVFLLLNKVCQKLKSILLWCREKLLHGLPVILTFFERWKMKNILVQRHQHVTLYSLLKSGKEFRYRHDKGRGWKRNEFCLFHLSKELDWHRVFRPYSLFSFMFMTFNSYSFSFTHTERFVRSRCLSLTSPP